MGRVIGASPWFSRIIILIVLLTAGWSAWPPTVAAAADRVTPETAANTTFARATPETTASAAIDRALGEVLAARDLQQQLPTPEQEPPQQPRPWRGPGWNFSLRWLVEIAPYALIALVALTLILNRLAILDWLARLLPRHWHRGRIAAAVPAEPADIAADHDWLREADALAVAGQHAAACGVLLTNLLPVLARQSARNWHPAITAREALRQLPLAGDLAAGLRRMVETAERGRFAGMALVVGDYQDSRDFALAVLRHGHGATHGGQQPAEGSSP